MASTATALSLPRAHRFAVRLPFPVLALLVWELLLVAGYWLRLAAPRSIEAVQYIFDLDSELSLSNWFSSLQLGAVGAVWAAFGYLQLRETLDGRRWRRALALPLTLVTMSALFVALSIDETVSVHERFQVVTEHFLGRDRVRGTFDRTGVWFLPLAPTFIALITVLLLQLRRAVPDASALRLLALGVAIFSLGAFALEALSNGFAFGSGRSLRIETSLEELAEMAGVTMMLWGSVRACSSRYVLALRPRAIPSAARD